ncbi:MAG TPA: glycerol-3-phosphate 1-O-acyltransferase PlsY [Dongiaceae bacterium]|nr:glycerol-3-phosphate 1-O-acyltransferase PlsY [Dongiaceae bacterium]
MHRSALILVAAYLLGSIPFGYLLVRIFRGEDVRKSGSGNIGATNVSRKSPVLGALTLLLDAAKGLFAVQLTTYSGMEASDPKLMRLMAAAALLAVAGHMFPVWLKFRGGKGVATALGAFLRFVPLAVGVAVIIFVLVVLISRRISLGSIITAALFPATVWTLHLSRDPGVLALIGSTALLIIFRHYRNMLRLLSGKEPRFSLGGKKGTPMRTPE